MDIQLKTKEDIKNWLSIYKAKQVSLSLWEKTLEWLDDSWSTIWYRVLFGRHIEEFIYEIKQFMIAVKHYNQGFGFTSDLDIWDFSHQTAKTICNRLRLLRHKIIMGETCSIWDSKVDQVENNILASNIQLVNLESNENDYSKFLPILDTMSFAFDYIAEPDKYKEDLFKELYGYEMYGWIYSDEEKPSTFSADWHNFYLGENGNNPGIKPLEDKKQKGLELFIKYLECLWD